ncbi:MAG: hypothetical protein NC517_10525 [Firmicutes bacterium]|nr:hypothetical protein [Bacillota bacterium]
MKEAAENGMEIKEIREAGRKREQIFFGAMESGNPRGFLCLKETGRRTE